MNDNPFGLGAHTSPYDQRTWQHPLDLAVPLTTGGIIYDPQDIENQHQVGICTAISLVQNAEKATGRKYSPDFQYLLQKKYYDLNWTEGSSIFSALKVGKNYGFLPTELFPYVTEADRTLPYDQYVAKLQAIPDAEITRLIGLCVTKLSGYAQLPTDPQSLAKGILDSKAGILTRYEVGKEWFTPSWLPKDIDPLRPPQQVISGHAIGKTYFDFTANLFTMANTWGTGWNVQGNAHVNPNEYACTEAWIPYYDAIPNQDTYVFTTTLYLGQTNNAVLQLQKRLGVTPQTGFFGPKTLMAVVTYQKANGLPPVGIVGPRTRALLNTSR